jgi:hypothetical protein
LSFEIIEQALNAEMERDHHATDPRPKPRPKPVRRMDALTNLCRRSLDRGEVGEIHGVRPHISAVVHIDATGDTAHQMRAEYRHGGHLSTSQLELLLCDCTISRVIIARHSEILDVGRATPTATAAQWKALVVRDRHCQAHHVRYYEHGGPTDLQNLRLYCWHHHREIHADTTHVRARPG